MTKRILSIVIMAYASNAAALPTFADLKNLQVSSLIEQVRVGLNSSMPPKTTLDDAWYSTYLLYFDRAESGYMGSGFVVHTERARDGRRTVDLVTSDHVIAKGCTDAKCTNLSIFAEASFVLDQGVLDQGLSVPLDEPQTTILARDANADLALLRITVDRKVNPRPVRLAREVIRTGDRVWAIGFPEVYNRTSGKGIDRRNVVTRRWSEGEVTGAVSYTQANTRLVSTAATSRSHYATTADALPGSSGGPMLNDAGELVCVLRSAGAVPSNRFEFPLSEVGASGCVPAASLRELLQRAYRQIYAANAQPVI